MQIFHSLQPYTHSVSVLNTCNAHLVYIFNMQAVATTAVRYKLRAQCECVTTLHYIRLTAFFPGHPG